MDKRTARKAAATLVALALLVLLALPAQPALALAAEPAAGAAAPGILPSLWSWVTEVAARATDGLADVWRATTSDPLPQPQRGLELDPDGAPSSQATTDPLPEPQRGAVFDPNG